MFRLQKLGWRLRQPFLVLWRRRRLKKNVAGFFLVVFSILILINHAAKAGYLRMSTFFMMKNDQGRKGKIMQKRTTGHAIDATRVWGIEVLDPLEQWEWGQSLWQRWSKADSRRPLLLTYSPAAERAALRGLTALTRIGREAEWDVQHFAPGFLPVLPEVKLTQQSFLLIHQSSRFLNAGEWIGRAAACRIVLTAPVTEFETIAGAEQFERITVPEEEPDYCERQAQKILEKFFADKTPAAPAVKKIAPLLREAGIMEVDLPITLLARHAGLDSAALIEQLQASTWRELIWWPETSIDTMTVVLRGRWLAEKVAPVVQAEPYSHLLAALKELDPQVPGERYFFLNLLMAWRSRGHDAVVAQLLRDYDDRFHDAAASFAAPERQAWGLLHPPQLRKRFYL